VVQQLEGKTIEDVFLRNGKIRAADHRVIHDAYLARVKPAGEVTEAWDYVKVLKTIPAAEAFRAPSAACKM
jgi:branched-chain amino acid transport system substrate-binding protein